MVATVTDAGRALTDNKRQQKTSIDAKDAWRVSLNCKEKEPPLLLLLLLLLKGK